MKYKNIKGLSNKEVITSRDKHGSNELPPPEIESFWDKLKENFEDPIIRILLVALAVTLLLAFLGYADWVEGFGIFIAVFLATFVSTYSEYKNESSFRLLQEQASKLQSIVFRNGSRVKLSAGEIVVGDYVLLQAGDKVPADGKIIEGELQVNQASLTGEQHPSRKHVSPNKYEPKDRKDFYDDYLCFRGSVVDDGEAVMLVESVGEKTCYGELYAELADSEDRDSPLKVKLSDLADGVSMVGYIGATAIAISFLFKQFIIDNKYNMEIILKYVSLENWHTVLHDVVTSVILAIIVIVVAVPEGLPMMIAIVLSLNMRKLLKANVLVRKLLGIETAGSIDILFVDKTGTLTKGIFEPKLFIGGNSVLYSEFSSIPKDLKSKVAFAIRESTSAVISESGDAIGGNASDRALIGFLDRATLSAKEDCTHEREVLFNSERKFSAVQLSLMKGIDNYFGDTLTDKKDKKKGKGETESNSVITVVKGAPEILFPHCKYYFGENGNPEEFNVEKLTEKIDSVSKNGIRVIAICVTGKQLTDDNIPAPLYLVGIIGIMDEIRKESKPSIELAKKAGIHVVMITGDRKETAVAVASELSLLDGNKQVLTSSQLKTLSDEKLQELIPNIGVIARALPTDKSRLVRLSQALGRVVGMTGDGVNDSAALKKADVGFAMGSGSEVAKEASDIVILDDNFASITKAVLYGRTIFKSIRKFIIFQSTVNCASFLIVFMGPFLGFDFPLTLIQLLWVNLVMDTLAALAFGGEPALKSTMSEPPVKRDASIINPYMWSAILINGIFIGTLCILSLTSPSIKDLFVRDGKPNEQVFLTAFFALFIFLTNFNSFNARTPKINVFDHIFENSRFVLVVGLIFTVQVIFTYLGGNVLRTVGLTSQEWMWIIGASVIIIPFDMIRKSIIAPIAKAEL